MKILDIVKQVGTSIVREVVPGGGLILDTVNAFLPDDKKLDKNATGEQIKQSIDQLEPSARAQLIEKEFDVELEQIKQSHDTLRLMLEMDANCKHTTRPKIALNAFRVVALIAISVIFTWSYAVYLQNDELVKAITGGWPFIASVVGPFIIWLNAYFGILKTEHKNRMDAARNVPNNSGLASFINLIKR